MSERRYQKTCEQLGIIFIPKAANCTPAEDEERLELLRRQVIAKRAKILAKGKLIRRIAATPFGQQLLLGRELYKRGYNGRSANALINAYLNHRARRPIAAIRRPTSVTSCEPDLITSTCSGDRREAFSRTSFVSARSVNETSLRPFVHRSDDFNNRSMVSLQSSNNAIMPRKVSSICSQDIST